MAKAKFTVDTHLFRELGELLVGRDSTALVELIKNSYDADATNVTVDGRRLGDSEKGRITISDDGVGMDADQFKQGFLTIASRFKEQGTRKSPKYQRRYTGAKGIGRLAAHKLAKFVRIYSTPSKDAADSDALSVNATIDWELVEAQETLDDVEGSGAIQLNEETRPLDAKPGTLIELKNLRRRWTPMERARFFAEVQTFSPPDVLVNLPSIIPKSSLLFHNPKIYDAQATDPGFQVELTGELASGEDYWETLVQAAQWVIEIDARQSDGKVDFNIIPTKKGQQEIPDAQRRTFTMDHPNSQTGPFFQSRILIREGVTEKRAERTWQGRSSGIRVYMEGFRVLPYGEPDDDWLSIDADYTRRPKTLAFLSSLGFAGSPVDSEEGLLFLRKASYFGAVFLTISNAPTLKMLVNREGFIPEAGYYNMVDILRTAVHLSVRVRATAKIRSRSERKVERRGQSAEIQEASRLELREAISVSVKRASDLAKEARKFAAIGDFKTAENMISEAAAEFSLSSSASERLMTEGAILRVLASVGTQMTAFVHEINGILGSAIALEESITRIRADRNLPAEIRKKLAKFQASVGDLRRSVERQASYLTDIVSPDARRRRSRQNLAERFEAGRRIVEHIAERRSIDIINEIPPGIKSPPMFPAELTLVFSNLLTNAVKAAGQNGRIRASAKRREDGTIILRIENTGIAVNPKGGDQWFIPFESTTIDTDPVLGQGMGMGLPITRNMLEEYGATIKFVTPDEGYATAIEICFEE